MALSFDDVQDIDKRTAERVQQELDDAIDQFLTLLYYAWNMKPPSELPPHEMQVLYANYPPVLPDGSIPGPSPVDGKWNWQEIAQQFSQDYQRHVERYAAYMSRALPGLERS